MSDDTTINGVLDEYTFGASKASTVLVDMLNRENKKTIRVVSSHFHSFARGIRMINVIPDLEVRRHLLELWMVDAKTRMATMKVNDKIKSYLTNIEKKLYRESVVDVVDMVNLA